MKDRIVGVSGALRQVRGLQPSLRSPRLDPWPGPSRETVSLRWAGDERESTIGIP